jgi:RHS repeat-associated protein
LWNKFIALSITTSPSGYTKIQDLTYTYDSVGNITKIVDNADTNTKKTVDYSYDDLSRLLSASSTNAVAHGNFKHVFAYTAIGNLASSTTAGGPYAYAGNTGSLYANPHAATTIATTSLTYDQNGNTTAVGSALGTTTYTWNFKNQMTQVTGTTTLATFGYDHTGDRVKLVEGGTTTYFPSVQYEVSGGTAKKYIYLGDQLVAIGENGAHVLVHTDHLGGTQVISGTSDTIAELNDYYPFGSLRFNEQNSYSNRKKFTGHEFDTSTGLSYMESRQQNGNQGRFLSQDPAFLSVGNEKELNKKSDLDSWKYLADPQGLNSYSYARNNPLNRIDKTGNYFETIFDIAMFSLSLNDFRQQKSISNGISVIADGVSLALPLPALVGAFRHADDTTQLMRYYAHSRQVARELNWGNPGSLLKHTIDHAGDFGLGKFDYEEYAISANKFLSDADNAIKQGSNNVESFIDTKGRTFYFDSVKRMFGIRNADGTTATAFKPYKGDPQKAQRYWNKQKATKAKR